MESFRVHFVLGLIALSLGHVSGAVDTSTIFFRHFNRDGSHDDVNINKITLLSSKLNKNECTLFHLHGFIASADDDSTRAIANAYLRKTLCNVLAIDYRQIVDNINYIGDALSVDTVGKAIANALDKLVQNGLNPDKIHITGHSLGAHVAGHVGSYTNFTVPRITGLDPAGPLFYTGRYLKSGDAKFVDNIHTDGGVFGLPLSTGDADFYPNGGHRPQPGCNIVPFEKSKDNESNCNHGRSWRYYAESVFNPDGFMAIQCGSSFLFDIQKCNRSNVVPMGFAAPPSARGKFYLRTNAESPYAKGMQGIY